MHSEYQPLLANSEARERAQRTAKKKRILLFVGLIGVGVVLVVGITVPIQVTRNKQAKLNNDIQATAGDNEVVLFEANW